MPLNESMFFEGLLAIIIFAFVPLTIKFTIATPLTICLFRLFITVVVLFPLDKLRLRSKTWWTLLFLGVFGTLIAHRLWASVSSNAKASHLGLAFYTIAPLTIFLSHFLLADSFSPLQACGGGFFFWAAVINIFEYKSGQLN